MNRISLNHSSVKSKYVVDPNLAVAKHGLSNRSVDAVLCLLGVFYDVLFGEGLSNRSVDRSLRLPGVCYDVLFGDKVTK